MKKVVSTLVLVGGLARWGTVLANNDSSLDITSDLYETIGLIEQATADLTEDEVEKVLLHDEFAERRLIVLEEVATEGNEEEIEHLVTDFIEVVTATENVTASAEEAGEDVNELRESLMKL
ncbi:hypothetical protein H1D32_08300 [Anaerobacillus sp. CMMVII]|uniref:DUF5667 domain-containing protein n=1 Tax=Anaerobacillus sp. CMMVII TaxID=2755588 RepID=UPI0021B7CDDA|nr:DUF5667 domain-containing protein [Anaerobacillus sp. CMMVII]MCT8137759.1 hypothetical protein [Anaerobacillus sp. CMMVII]